ncbi:hypothetical protein Dda_6068 [Drechslerella dactyloides]|uniref:HNH nuclease domain-containing protein n=1 Tax=Drechslerella dactyloides TaxID=74499 RepID=A0AAD6IX23_DREDA|nr:hypothetical protein Dda_6068 [Drechslerella dactyloides]
MCDARVMTMSTNGLARPPASLWSTLALPIPKDLTEKVISINHPSYTGADTAFLQLPALDIAPEQQPGTGGRPKWQAGDNEFLTSADDLERWKQIAGIHRGTVTLACYVLTGNKHGVLSPTPFTNQAQIDQELRLFDDSNLGSAYDEVLTADKYFWYPVDYFDNQNYYITTKFRTWDVPNSEALGSNPVYNIWQRAHNADRIQSNYPKYDMKRTFERPGMGGGSASEIRLWVTEIDETCRFTGSHDLLKAWRQHSLTKKLYSSDESAFKEGVSHTCHPENLISMCPNVQAAFDQQKFFLTVKSDTFVANFISSLQSNAQSVCLDTLRLLHNRPLREPSSTNLLFIFIHLAWCTFRHVNRRFLLKNQHCLTIDIDTSPESTGITQEVQDSPDPSRSADQDVQPSRRQKRPASEIEDTEYSQGDGKQVRDEKRARGDNSDEQLTLQQQNEEAVRADGYRWQYKQANPQVSVVANSQAVWEEGGDSPTNRMKPDLP